MPTTTYSDATFSVAAIGGRTDSAGADVTDYTAEEARFAAQILTGGRIEPALSFAVRAQVSANMSVRVGSDVAKADYYLVEGETGGQGNYVVRLDAAAVTVTVPAAEAAQTRTDEVYLVVRDDVYDESARGLPQIGYRKGDPGGALPGPDATWEAAEILARITVPAAALSIVTANIADLRPQSMLKPDLAGAYLLKSTLTAKGDLYAATAAGAVARLPVGPAGSVLRPDSAAATGLSYSDIGVTQVRVLSATDSSSSSTFELIGEGAETFTFLAPAGSRWAVEAFLLTQISSTEDMVLDWSYGSSIDSILWSVLGPSAAATTDNGSINYNYLLKESQPSIGGTPYGGQAVRIAATVSVSSSGQSINSMQFASSVNGETVAILVGSWFKFTRLS